MDNSDYTYKNKYIKYKNKYLNLKKKSQKLIGGAIKKFTICTYNVYGNGSFNKERLDSTISEIINNTPDVICLQEASQKIIADIQKKLPNYDTVTLLQILEEDNETTQEDLNKVRKRSYLAILSKWKIKSYELAVKGNWLDDGIIKAVLDTKIKLGYYLTIYNVHTVGGTFNKPPEVVKKKRERRIFELESLKEKLLEDTGKNVIVMGDFNLDSNDAINYPEVNYLPEKVIDTYKDIWSEKGPVGDPGNTESHINNPFRVYLKPGQNREARYDKIIYSGNNLEPESIELIGNKPIGNVKDKDGKEVTLLPSDHFGLRAVIKNIN